MIVQSTVQLVVHSTVQVVWFIEKSLTSSPSLTCPWPWTPSQQWPALLELSGLLAPPPFLLFPWTGDALEWPHALG